MNVFMKPLNVCFLAAFILLSSCSKNIFRGRSTPHGLYKEALVNAGLQNTYMVGQWISVGDKSLQRPVKINLPYKENGYFAADKPSASGYIFTLRRGDKLKVALATNPATGIKVFIELWLPAKISANDFPLAVMDSVNNTLQYAADKEGDYILRLQAELLKGIEYNITITTEPSLAFPVQQSGKPRIISLWGVGRDNGTRSHEGIDISAAFRTPALAVADGYITRVGENNLGGKVVFLRPHDLPFSVYYAHLDSQSVRQGQTVKTGDIVGLVGNTGNAKNTVPHLHFGIYANNGAIDPLAFVDKNRAQPKAVTGSNKNFDKWMRAQKSATVYASPDDKMALTRIKGGDIMLIQSAAANLYKIMLPDGREGFINNDQVLATPLRKQKLTAANKLLDAPFINAPAKISIAANSEVEVKGLFENFMLVKFNNVEGWLSLTE